MKGGEWRGRTGRLVEFGGIRGDAPRSGLREPDGKWEIQLDGAEAGSKVRVDLCHVRPEGDGAAAQIEGERVLQRQPKDVANTAETLHHWVAQAEAMTSAELQSMPSYERGCPPEEYGSLVF